MSRTRIEWVRNEDGSAGYTINPIKGLCPVGCSYCYARRLYQRFHWNPEIRFDVKALMEPIDTLWGERRTFFVGSTMELFAPWIKPEWWEEIIGTCEICSEHTFIFLTKLPENLPREWPDNCWVGVTATNTESFMRACTLLEYPLQAKVKFLSLEPFLSWDYNWSNSYLANTLKRANIGWLIIGQQTPVRKSTMPKVEWIQEIVQAADKASVPIFMKNNLCSVFDEYEERMCYCGPVLQLRQEFPRVTGG